MRSGRRPRVGLTGVRAVGAEGDLKGSIVMSFEDERLSLVLRASDPHGLIVISGDDAPAAGAEGRCSDGAAVSFREEERLSGAVRHSRPAPGSEGEDRLD